MAVAAGQAGLAAFHDPLAVAFSSHRTATTAEGGVPGIKLNNYSGGGGDLFPNSSGATTCCIPASTTLKPAVYTRQRVSGGY